MTDRKSTIPLCHHIHPNGRRCGSPALRYEQFCFYHHPTRRPPTRIRPEHSAPFELPAITDAEELQIALSEVGRRIADHTLDSRRAGLLVAALQMARANLPAFSRLSAGLDLDPESPDFSRFSGLLPVPSLRPNPSASGR